MADPNSPWGILPPELVARIVHFLSPNEVACTCRLINKATAKQFKGCISVRLSQPVPHHAFVRRWGDERCVHGLTLERRRQLFCLMVRSGVIANLEVAVAALGCGLTQQIFNAAAEGGHILACIWLLDRGCRCKVREFLCCASRAGHTEVVRWVLAQSPEVAGDALSKAAGAGQRALCEELLPLVLPSGRSGAIRKAACEAAEGGHVELTERLLGQLAEPTRISDGELLRCAAYGFELPALQRLFHSRLGSEAPAELGYEAYLAATVLASPTPDWRAKLEWLESAGCRLGQFQCWNDIAKRGDVVERVALLRERGLMKADFGRLLGAAIKNSYLPVVRYLRSEGLLTGALGDGRAMNMAMEVGDLAVLVELLAACGTVKLDEVHTAACHGHLHVFRWLEGPEAGPAAAAVLQKALRDVVLAEWGARSGSLELMEWLWERGCPTNEERVFTAAVQAGNAALLERLVARGCPMSDDAYLQAGRNSDLATLRCLKRLDCPWDRGCSTLDQAMFHNPDLQVLRWLVAEGCPVNWQSARARARRRGGAADVVAWIESHIPRA